jgi:hypothetical protein
MGRFAWTNHIYFQLTQPGSSTITPLPIEAAEICARRLGIYVLTHYSLKGGWGRGDVLEHKICTVHCSENLIYVYLKMELLRH